MSLLGRSAASEPRLPLPIVLGAVMVLAGGLSAVAASATEAAPTPAPTVGALEPSVASTAPFSTGMAASLVLGQVNFTTNATSDAPDGLDLPFGAAFDGLGDLWVADSSNNRVLEYVPPFHNGMGASVALGQATLDANATSAPSASTLSEPQGIAFTPTGALWVADRGNARVLEFLPPFVTGMAASVVLGQGSFTTDAVSDRATATALYQPSAVCVLPDGELAVSDGGNNRIVLYAPPFTSGEAATVALGQSSLSGDAGATTAVNLSQPQDVAATANGSLWVADSDNDRAVEFVAPLTTGEAASVVLGETSFTDTSEGLPLGMFYPVGVAVDSHGDVWVADSSLPNRVSGFLPPFSNNQAPAVVLGQASPYTTFTGTNRTDTREPSAIAVDPVGNLWVADRGNSRVLEYGAPEFPTTFVESGLPTGNSWSVRYAGTTETSNTTVATFLAPNGTWSYTVEGVAGYRSSPSSGATTVNGTVAAIAIAFSPNPGGVPGGLWLYVSIAAIVVAAVEAVLLLRTRPGRRPPIAPVAPPVAAAPGPTTDPTAGGSPAGGAGSPPAPPS